MGYINRSQKHEYGNWERGRAVSCLGIFFSNFFIFGTVSLQCKDSLSRYGELDEINLSIPRKNPKFSANAPVDGSLKVGGREYCMIYRRQEFLRSYASAPRTPLPLSHQQVVSLSQSSSVLPVEFTDGRGGGGGAGEKPTQESLARYKSFNTFCLEECWGRSVNVCVWECIQFR